MPRLANPDYLAQRRNLIDYWEDEHVAWAYLLPQEQWQLHDFYQPSKYLTDEQGFAHRAEISEQRLSLPQLPGKAYKVIMSFEPVTRDHLANLDPVTKNRKTRKRAKNHVVKVRALVRPEPDIMKLSRALVDHFESLPEAKREQLIARAAARAKKRPGSK